jgi:hypothetical protein
MARRKRDIVSETTLDSVRPVEFEALYLGQTSTQDDR